jgi:hypothetical protein
MTTESTVARMSSAEREDFITPVSSRQQAGQEGRHACGRRFSQVGRKKGRSMLKQGLQLERNCIERPT